MTSLPEPFDLTLDAFLKGPGREELALVIDRVFAKRLPAVLADAAEDDPDAIDLADVQMDRGSPSTARPGYRFVGISNGVLLLDDRRRIVGAYAGSDLALKPALRGFGLGRELVVERALRHESMPLWHHDVPCYTPAGLAAHRSAWQRAQDDPQSILDKLDHIG